MAAVAVRTAPTLTRRNGPLHAQGPDSDRRRGRPRALILRVPGTNCARETALACEAAGAQAEIATLREVAADPDQMAAAGLLVIPGGFAHGDYLGAGTLLSAEMRVRLGYMLEEFVDQGRLVLGICNGFQALARLGLLPDVALAPNASGRFECRWVELSASPRSACIFTRGLARLALPVAHGEGRVVVRDAAALERLDADGCLALRYVSADGRATVDYPDNPNGSTAAIAGLCNRRGNVLGLMPHPERAALPHQPGRAGLALFKNAVAYLRERDVSHAL